MSLVIALPSSLEGADFEDVLNNFLAKSHQRTNKSITFDMSRVEWCELYELSLFTVWIWGLVHAHKSVTLIYPVCDYLSGETDNERSTRVEKRKKVCSYLNRWEFDKYLRSRGISIEGHDQDYPYWPTQPEQQSILPLRFFQDAVDFQSFLSNLSDSKQLELLFQDSVLLSVIGSGGMRDVILKEVGQNIYDHAGGSCAFCTIGAIPSIPQGAPWARRKLKNSLERDFFYTLGRSGYLQVIIADHGPGINSTLLKAYKEDKRISEHGRATINAVDVLAYAFEFDSTSKKRKDLMSLPNEEEDPGRGLYWVREIALQNKGFLSVRSGSSLIRFDFLNSSDRHAFRSYGEGDGLARLAPLGGTQFKLLFPLDPDLISSRVQLRSFSASSARKDNNAQPIYFVVELPHQIVSDSARRLDELRAVLENVPRPLGRTGSSFVVIFDFSNTTWQKDVLVPFLMRLSAMQHEGLTAVLANTSHLSQLLAVASPILGGKIKSNPLKFRVLPVWNSTGFSIIGVPDQDRSYIEPLWGGGGGSFELPLDSSDYWLHRYGHLIDLSPSGVFVPRLGGSNIEKSLASHYASRIKSLILDEKVGIYHEGKFLLPTNVYVDGYFQLAALLKGDQQRRLLRIIGVSSIRNQSSDVESIISLSPELELLGKEVAEDLQLLLGRKILVTNLGDLRGEEVPRNLLAPIRGKKAVIITGVLGTARTLEVTIDACRFMSSPINIMQVFCIIDARDKSSVLRRGSEIVDNKISYEGTVYPLSSILVHSLRFYDSRPANWRREEIIRIDPVTNAPAPARLEPATSPLWQPVDRFFLENIVLNSGALRVGHYVRHARHYIYFFDMVTLASNVGPEIAGKIKTDIVDYCKNSQAGEADVSHVIFDESNRGAQAVAHQVSKVFERIEPISVQTLVSASRVEREALIGRDVIIFLSSVVRGNHLQSLLDAVATCRPRRIFAYAIMHRKESDTVPFYQRVDNYHGIETRIRYFVELEIPSFTVWDCPACNMRNQLNEIYEAYEDEQLRGSLAQRLDEMAPRLISSENNFATLDGDVPEFVRQTVLRRMLGAAKTELQARYPIADLLEDRNKNWDEALRLLQVFAREIVLFATYEELLYPEFRKLLNQACLDALIRTADPENREECALIILRHLSPDFLVSNLLSIFRGVSFKENLIYPLLVGLFALVVKNQVELASLLNAINLCQSALDNDEVFTELPVSRVIDLQNMLNFIARRMRIRQVRAELGETSIQLVFTKLWYAFVRQPGRVHPELVQAFTHVISTHSLASFRDIYVSAYEGPQGLGAMCEQVIPLFDPLSRFLRPEIRNNLVYFFSRAEGTFGGDLEVLDNSLRTMATLDRQGRLTDEEVDRLFFNNARVNASIGRLRRYAFDENSILRQVLRGKFSSVSYTVREVLRQWEHAFMEKRINVEFRSQEADAFSPSSVLADVLGGFLSNIHKHAFRGTETLALVTVEITRKAGNVLITLEDTGRGISQEDIERRPDGGIRRSNGLLARYGGSVKPESRVDKSGERVQGTTVTISLLSKEEVLSWGRD